MKILFINRSDYGGGAATAAWRLGQEMTSACNTDNYYLVDVKKSSDKKVVEVRPNLNSKIFGIIINKLFNTVGLQYQFLPFSALNILSHVRKIKPDIISLHNIHGGYFQTSLLIKLSKLAPIVWTLHDMWPVTRNAAHTFGDNSWKVLKTFPQEKNIYPTIGFDTGSYLLKRKEHIYRKSNISFIAPSKWMEQIAKDSPLLKGKKIFHIYHGIDQNRFKLMNTNNAKKKLGLSANNRVIMFGADIVNNNPWKGGDLLSEILDILDKTTKRKLTLLIIGKGNTDFLRKYNNLKIKFLGHIDNEDSMVDCYNAADCFINPTRADSLSLMLVEAISCGLPCVTYAIGGTKEVIINGVNGYSIEPFDNVKFADRILIILNNDKVANKMSKSAIKITKQKFLLQNMAKEYYKIFDNIQKHE